MINSLNNFSYVFLLRSVFYFIVEWKEDEEHKQLSSAWNNKSYENKVEKYLSSTSPSVFHTSLD